jgi:hypothetical protein
VTKAKLHNPETSLSSTFERTAAEIRTEFVTIGDLLELIGEQGLLLFCIFLATPFLFPVSIPGSSTALGIVILLIGVGVMTNTIPWLPEKLLAYQLRATSVVTILGKAAVVFRRFEKLIRPRLLGLTGNAAINILNGAMLIVVALLLLIPLPLIPFTNTIPAIAIVLLCLGMAERDGVVIVLGYVATLASCAYIGAILWGAWRAGSGIGGYLQGLFGG